MKHYKKSIATILLLALAPLSTFANLPTKTSQCDNQEAPSIFILSALFANTSNPYPVELWENRDNEVLNIFDLAREIKSIASHKATILSNSNDSILLQRLSQMEDIANRALIMEADKWKPHYVNELMKHIIGIRHAGISDLLPTVLDPDNCKEKRSTPNPCDENGTPWTSFSNLTNLNDEGPSIAHYMQQHETDIQFIRTWWTSQLGDSWGEGCRAVKLFYSNQRNLDPQTYYYWGSNGYKAAEDEYSIFWKQGASSDADLCYPKGTNKEEQLVKTFTIWHAYVQEALAKSKFYHNDQVNNQVCLTRTAGLRSLSRNNITHAGKGYIMPSAAYDSFTLIKIYMKNSPDNKAIAESSVPHHRIINLYPLIQMDPVNDVKKLLDEEKQELTNLIINKFYNNSGSLILDLSNSIAINEAFEKIVYNQENHFKPSFHLINLRFYNSFCIKMLSALPEILTPDNLPKLMNNFFSECISEWNDAETEFVVLSGPDLPFDYFYNTTDALSHYEKRLNSGESVCGFWPTLEDLKQIDESTGLYQDSKTGKKYVIKKGASEDHIRTEFLADLFYARADFAVPESRLYGTSDGPFKVASYLEGSQSLYIAYHNADEAEKQRLRNEIAKGFMLDALIANGQSMDNILVGSDGQVYRVDNSASFHYAPDRAWNPSPITLWSLRDSKGDELFSDINIYEVAEDINNYYEAQTVSGINERSSIYYEHERLINYNVPKLASQMEIRKENFHKVASKALGMKAQGLNVQEADIELRMWVEGQDWSRPAFD